MGNEQQTTTKKRAKVDAVKSNFIDVLKEIRKGNCLYDLSEQMEELVGAIKEQNKSGKLSLVLNIEPYDKGDATRVTIVDKINIKKPEKTNGKTTFFPTSNNALSRKDPNQMDFSDVEPTFEDEE